MPLHAAAQRGDAAMVELLLTHGANVGAEHHGVSPSDLSHLIVGGHVGLVGNMLEQSDSITVYHLCFVCITLFWPETTLTPIALKHRRVTVAMLRPVYM